jgi:hypothetical protein
MFFQPGNRGTCVITNKNLQYKKHNFFGVNWALNIKFRFKSVRDIAPAKSGTGFPDCFAYNGKREKKKAVSAERRSVY